MSSIHSEVVHRPGFGAQKLRQRIASADHEFIACTVLLAAALAIGLATAADYGITTDEFIFDGYGPKALAWYTSAFTDRSLFDHYDTYLYGPWFQTLVAIAQSLQIGEPFAVRHAVTFVVGLAGIAALLPIGRLAVGRWAGFAAIVLCLTTGNLYGHLFFTPYDIPFMAAMTWATLAIIVMSRTPTWPATIAAGLLTGLAVATRFGGVLTQVYLVGAMGLCALEIGLRPDGRAKTLLAIGAKTVVALMLGWLFAIALWPWLQSTDPIGRFKTVYDYFVSSYVHFDFPYWGETVSSKALPWHYIPGQLLARLPEAFIALLIVALVFGLLAGARFLIDGVTGIRRNGLAGAVAPALELARARGLLVVAVAALAPAIFVVVRGSVIFDGLRHMLFILPPLAVLAAWGLLRLMPLIRRVPLVFAAAGMMHVAATVAVLVILHPLEYVAMNGFAGGTAGAYGRFDLDYWAAAATQAVRNLEARLADSGTVSQSSRPPRVLVCIGFRENMVAPMFARRWHAETEPRKADFIVETERWRCGSKVGGTTIDRIERFGRTFARTIATTPRAGRPAVSSADELPVTDDDL